MKIIQTLEVVGRGSETQLQVGGNSKKVTERIEGLNCRCFTCFCFGVDQRKRMSKRCRCEPPINEKNHGVSVYVLLHLLFYVPI